MSRAGAAGCGLDPAPRRRQHTGSEAPRLLLAIVQSLHRTGWVLLVLGDPLEKTPSILASFPPGGSCLKGWIELGRGQR